MKRNRSWVVLALAACGPLLIGGGVSAHSSYPAFVPRLTAVATVPIVDGICQTTEYTRSLRYSILYVPRLNWPSARIYLASTAADLHVCLSGMPLSNTAQPSFASVTIDTAHDGGRVPDSDDLSFLITSTGVASARRGDGSGGFVASPETTGWTAVHMVPDDFSWAAEYRIPLSLLGGGLPLSTVGLEVRQGRVLTGTDGYSWPPSAVEVLPNSWGDLIWGVAPTGPLAIQVDVSRITQGLEQDVTGRVGYDLVTGKETLVRAQLYQLGVPARVSSATCTIQQVTRLDALGARTPVSRPVQVVPVSLGADVPRLNSSVFGFFNGSDVFNCWAPSGLLAEAGDYRFGMRISLEGGTTPAALEIGSRSFLPTADLRVLVSGYIWPPGHAFRIPWTDSHWASAVNSLQEIVRMSPIRDGAGLADRSGVPTAPPRPGIRYHLIPAIYDCQLEPGDNNDPSAAFGRCNAQRRAFTFRAMIDQNEQLKRLDESDGRHRDRFDREITLDALPVTIGGQAQFLAERCSTGSGVDSNISGDSGVVLGQELVHCLGEVSAGSPHSDGGNHTTTCAFNQSAAFPGCLDRTQTYPGPIPLFQGQLLVNVRTRTDFARPATLLSPIFLGGLQSRNLMEGWDWNHLRRTLLTLPRPVRSQAGAASERGLAKPLFLLSGRIDHSGKLTVDDSARVDGRDLQRTPDSPNSPYALVFLDGEGRAELGRLGFVPHIESTHDDVEQFGLVLVATLPEGSARFEIRKDQTVLSSQDFTQAAPQVSGVGAKPATSVPGIELGWIAADQDSPTLRYSIYFQPDPALPRELVAAGLTSKSFLFPTSFAPAGKEARLIVEASDGYNTASAASNPFEIAARPPVLAIASPNKDTTLVAGQPITLSGAGLVYGDPAFSGDLFFWSSDRDGSLGTGDRLEVHLSPGPHTLTLMATTAARQTAGTSVQLVVLEDSDGDGLPDAHEQGHTCLSAAAADGGDDPDGDTLTSRGERAAGTDPCQADSDEDGVGDGDELRLGSDPQNAQILPAPDRIFLAEDTVDLGACPEPEAKVLQVLAEIGATWAVSSDSDWLVASGGTAGNGSFKVEANCEGLANGRYTGQVFIGVDGGQLRSVQVNLRVVATLSLHGLPSLLLGLCSLLCAVRYRRGRGPDPSRPDTTLQRTSATGASG